MEDKGERTGIGRRRSECRSFICERKGKIGLKVSNCSTVSKKFSAKLRGWGRGQGESPSESWGWRHLVLGRKALARFVTGSEQPQGKCGFAVSTAMDTGDSSHDCSSALLPAAVVWKEMGAMRSQGHHMCACALSYSQCVFQKVQNHQLS